MRWIEVNSTLIAAIGYDVRNDQLGIDLHGDGGVYFYFDVPFSEFRAFLAAESKGTYLNSIFKKKAYPSSGPHLGRKRAA